MFLLLEKGMKKLLYADWVVVEREPKWERDQRKKKRKRTEKEKDEKDGEKKKVSQKEETSFEDKIQTFSSSTDLTGGRRPRLVPLDDIPAPFFLETRTRCRRRWLIRTIEKGKDYNGEQEQENAKKMEVEKARKRRKNIVTKIEVPPQKVHKRTETIKIENGITKERERRGVRV